MTNILSKAVISDFNVQVSGFSGNALTPEADCRKIRIRYILQSLIMTMPGPAYVISPWKAQAAQPCRNKFNSTPLS